MSCHGGFSLDEATRRSWYNPEQILQSVGLGLGMVFVDVGCGDGFFSILASQTVGEKGKVYAIDIDKSGIEKLKSKAKSQRIENITAIVGKAEEVVACSGCADIVFYSMDLHDFNDPAQVLRNAYEMLSPNGLLVDLDWKKTQMPFGPPVSIRFSEEQASNLMKTQGFKIVKQEDAGPYHYLVTAKPTKR